jgi:hypothetical protein
LKGWAARFHSAWEFHEVRVEGKGADLGGTRQVI